MTTIQNAKAKNEFMKTGMVANYFTDLKKTIQVNDGTRSFVPKTRDCHDSQAPFQANQFVLKLRKIQLTSLVQWNASNQIHLSFHPLSFRP